jgi:hypothetical protein
VTRPPWEVADVIRRAGSKFRERYRQSLAWAQVKVLTAIVTLPYGCTRGASRPVPALRLPGHLLQLLP